MSTFSVGDSVIIRLNKIKATVEGVFGDLYVLRYTTLDQLGQILYHEDELSVDEHIIDTLFNEWYKNPTATTIQGYLIKNMQRIVEAYT